MIYGKRSKAQSGVGIWAIEQVDMGIKAFDFVGSHVAALRVIKKKGVQSGCATVIIMKSLRIKKATPAWF